MDYSFYKIIKNNNTNTLSLALFDTNGNILDEINDINIISNILLKLEGKTDEFGFTPQGTLTDEFVKKVLSYKMQISGDLSRLDPEKKNFAMYADSPANFHSNIIFPDGVTASCESASSSSTKEITLVDWNDESLPARCDIDVTFTHGNTYGETTVSSPTHPQLLVKNADGDTIGTFDICDSRGHFAGKGCWNDGDLICFKRSGNKMLMTNHDVREATSDYKIYSDNLSEYTKSKVDALFSDMQSIIKFLNKLNVTDTRYSNLLPKDYDKGVYFEFKLSNSINTPFGDYYALLITMRAYGSGTDMSGGGVVQWAVATNKLKVRYSTSTTSWSSWQNPNVVSMVNPNNTENNIF